MTNQQLLELAQLHAERLENDIKLARTRDEHIRVTARANEAAEMVNGLLKLQSNEPQPVRNISGMGFIY
jgi:hypothetical protein